MDDETFWNTRYAAGTYLYGTEPNSFLAEHCGRLASPVLSLSEGEGRNAVFLASRGLKVVGVDISSVALAHAEQLARERGVAIETVLADLGEYEPEPNHFGSIISISAHLPSAIRHRLYPMLEAALKPGGILLLEAYSESQLARSTGGPKDADMLMTQDKLRRELPGLEVLHLREVEREVVEGQGHTGLASVVQFIGRKKE